MNLKWKGIIFGVFISLLITATVILALSYFQVPSWLNYSVFIGFFLGGAIAIYISKLKTLKGIMIIGSFVGIISFILYYIGIRIVFDVLIPLLYTQPVPQAFLMAGIVEKQHEPTIVDQLRMAWDVVLYGILFSTISLLGGYSFYLVSSLKKKETLKKIEVFGYIILMILLLGLLFSANFYLFTAIGLILIIFTIAFFIFIRRKEIISQ
jgi:hypothetical protein